MKKCFIDRYIKRLLLDHNENCYYFYFIDHNIVDIIPYEESLVQGAKYYSLNL